jgi:hypothetical protein
MTRAVVPQTEMVYDEKQPTGERPMPGATLEERMTALEEAVRELQEAMKAREGQSVSVHISGGEKN